MIFEQQKFSSLLLFSQFRSMLAAFNQAEESDRTAFSAGAEAQAFISALQALQVSETSLFLEEEWDFNRDFPNASRYIRGAKLRMNFAKFPNIPDFAILELKAAFLIHYKALSALSPNGDTRVLAQPLSKPNTVITRFESGLRFVDKIFAVAANELGKEHVDLAMGSVSSLPAHYYGLAAQDFDCVFDDAIVQFFKAIRSVHLEESVFGSSLPVVDLTKLNWKLLGKRYKADAERVEKSQLLSNLAFEISSLSSSLAVVDFLDALGEPVVDQSSLNRRNGKEHFDAKVNGLNPLKLNLYIYNRLSSKGVPREEVDKVLGEGCMTSHPFFAFGHKYALVKYEELTGSRFGDEFREYLNYVNYSCQYLIAQYTGMRPSELAEIIAAACLKNDGRFPLIRSSVSKHEDNLVGLFDDFWVAIPIVLDAIRACVLINKYKNNKYVFSNMDTVAFGKEAKPYSAGGYKLALDKFFEKILPADAFAGLGFNAYMLRHTLAYQLYRADLGLPFISHQLKHFGEFVGIHSSTRGFSETTLGYGEIGDMLAKGGGRKSDGKNMRHQAEIESIKSFYDPDGSYAGVNSAAHIEKLHRLFQGYMAAGYTKDDIFEAMAAQHIAIVNVGQGFCYGGSTDEFDSSIPCIGGLRCNPNRCKNAVVSPANAPNWREVFYQNKAMLENLLYAHNHEQNRAAMEEARGVLRLLGEEV